MKTNIHASKKKKNSLRGEASARIGMEGVWYVGRWKEEPALPGDGREGSTKEAISNREF